MLNDTIDITDESNQSNRIIAVGEGSAHDDVKFIKIVDPVPDIPFVIQGVIGINLTFKNQDPSPPDEFHRKIRTFDGSDFVLSGNQNILAVYDAVSDEVALLTGSSVVGGDNLGNHIATMDLEMGPHTINFDNDVIGLSWDTATPGNKVQLKVDSSDNFDMTRDDNMPIILSLRAQDAVESDVASSWSQGSFNGTDSLTAFTFPHKLQINRGIDNMIYIPDNSSMILFDDPIDFGFVLQSPGVVNMGELNALVFENFGTVGKSISRFGTGIHYDIESTSDSHMFRVGGSTPANKFEIRDPAAVLHDINLVPLTSNLSDLGSNLLFFSDTFTGTLNLGDPVNSYTITGLPTGIEVDMVAGSFLWKNGANERMELLSNVLELKSGVILDMKDDYIAFEARTAPVHTTPTSRYLFQDISDNHMKIRTDSGLIDLETGVSGGLTEPLRHSVKDHGNVSGAQTITADTHNVFRIRLTGDISISISETLPAGKFQMLHLVLIQDGTGGHTVTLWDSAINGTPSIGTNPDEVTTVSLYSIDAGVTWYFATTKGGILNGGSGATQLNDLTDVTLVTPSSGNYLRYGGSVWANSDILWPDINFTGSSIDDLDDVLIGTPSANTVLKWSGSAWVDGLVTLSNMSDGTPGKWLKYNDSTGVLEETDIPSGVGSEFDDDVFRIRDNLDSTRKLAFSVGGIDTSTTRTLIAPNHDGTIITDQGNQTLTGIKTFQNGAIINILDANSTKIVNVTTPTISTDAANKAYVDSVASGGPHTLGSHSDVSLSGLVTDHVIRWNGSAWVNGQVTSGMIAANTITDADISGIAGIAKSKISSSGTWTVGDLPSDVSYKSFTESFSGQKTFNNTPTAAVFNGDIILNDNNIGSIKNVEIAENYATGTKPAGSTNIAKLFCVPTAGGKTELRVAFQTGGSVLIAVEP